MDMIMFFNFWNNLVLNPSYRTHIPLVQNYATKHWPSTRQTSVNHYEYFQSSTALYSLMMDRVRSETCWS